MEEREIIKYKGNFKNIAKKIVYISIALTIICFITSGIFNAINDYHRNKRADLYEIWNDKIEIKNEKSKAKSDIDNKIYKSSARGEYLKNLNNSQEYQNAKKEYEIAIEESEKAYEEYKNYRYQYRDEDTPFIFGCIFGGCIIITILFYWYISKMEITVTTTRVYGKKAFGKRVDLPLDTISVVGTSFLRGIDIGTSSGRIHFKGIKNNDEIHNEISKLLNNRQSNRIETNQNSERTNNISTAEELKQYKELLDTGVITQDEFEAKKKQLLGI